jgi:hypothetical protein
VSVHVGRPVHTRQPHAVPSTRGHDAYICRAGVLRAARLWWQRKREDEMEVRTRGNYEIAGRELVAEGSNLRVHHRRRVGAPLQCQPPNRVTHRRGAPHRHSLACDFEQIVR